MTTLFRRTFTIAETQTPITEPITKFGGQPVWINEPTWPLAFETGEKMLFMGQIALEDSIFPNSNGVMVYVFIWGDAEPLYAEAMAVVIQTPEMIYKTEEVEYISDATGLSIYEFDENSKENYKEYEILLSPIKSEIATPPSAHYNRYDELDIELGYNFSRPEFAGNKIGGQPLYINQPTNPREEFDSKEWLLLLQLAPQQGYYLLPRFQPNFYPFSMELGEFGILTIFIANDYTQAKLFIQLP
ncbi:DUF1963 domain-containing protein [Anabaena cylindrica FACHB-243]|uniref:DUF1963 domain-containing protein n=1 Tax=Anabaena cylindrica (strain ATCC 27899 / PCC 7122) TaxID=272123 RepID=K9ZG36_ANACC|nr:MULTISPECIES: DUF1963 domain-containing protein [Anabaena]AFZ57320.1 hypothetical protein Anacy_1830 [Anabaena cylindrica PCC 7122]MBD2420988.1 DUF1963 domain-containing protein [Anabaena cylindrica FACHB-243]MBY5284746.1 DUF1963 domain-containing protein [Anabaena sp. CCAP 1446/1C]MBY5308338.1 DUF1963 domain-containing protein [Anabaena sp. CCAP 1446/1C]MCM2405741.1 DUF1963 domain-containing protein [Anabaena sp. CCAP 1446/1C]